MGWEGAISNGSRHPVGGTITLPIDLVGLGTDRTKAIPKALLMISLSRFYDCTEYTWK